MSFWDNVKKFAQPYSDDDYDDYDEDDDYAEDYEEPAEAPAPAPARRERRRPTPAPAPVMEAEEEEDNGFGFTPVPAAPAGPSSVQRLSFPAGRSEFHNHTYPGRCLPYSPHRCRTVLRFWE